MNSPTRNLRFPLTPITHISADPGRVWLPDGPNDMCGTTQRDGELRLGRDRCGERREIGDELVELFGHE